MIKLMLCCAFCFINTAAFAQKTTKTWVVNNPPYKGREKADIVVDRVELTPAYTIIGFVFDNSKGEDERFTICNTFKIE